MADLESFDIQGDPERRERAYLWHTAIGLQKTDGLTPSDYLISIANKNINGDITLEEAHNLIEDYYKARHCQPWNIIHGEEFEGGKP